MMRATFLGTGAGGTVSAHRGHSALALRHDDGIWLFDAGEGTTVRADNRKTDDLSFE